MLKTHSYNDTFDTIGRYANDSLWMFADGWSRFPAWQVSEQLIAILEPKQVWWAARNQPEAAQQIGDAIAAIKYYMEKL
jgi:hypothetical protein